MKNCPGKVEMTKGKVHRYVLSDRQKAWLKRYFPTTENVRLAESMGVTPKKVRDFAREMGLKKSEEGLREIKARQVAKAVETNNINGCYERKRGHPCSKATMEGNRRRWEEEHKGIRENVMIRMKREDPEKYKQWTENMRKYQKEVIRKEKMRVVYGLERKTKLKVIVMKPYTQSQKHHRCNALKRGYVLNEDCSEGNPYRYVIFYDDDTKRNAVFERNCKKDGFEIQKW